MTLVMVQYTKRRLEYVDDKNCVRLLKKRGVDEENNILYFGFTSNSPTAQFNKSDNIAVSYASLSSLILLLGSSSLAFCFFNYVDITQTRD